MQKQRTESGGTSDLVTPTLKSDLYTTGRGGQGNMAKNDYGQEARAAQDVETPAAHSRNTEGESYHYGRGGAANITKKNEAQEASGHATKEGESTGDKAKGLLEKIGLKKN